MPDFHSISELARFIGTPVGQGYLFKNSTELKNALKSEMNRLQRYLTEEINAHYNSYQPEQYKRTGAWIESIRVNPIQRNGQEYSITLTFDDGQAYHPSIAGGEPGYVPWRMEIGWKSRSYDTPHFEGFKGTQYIKKAVGRWNKDNRFGFSIAVFYNDMRYI